MRTKPVLAQRQVDFRQIPRHAQGELVILGLYGLAKPPEPQREPRPPPRPPTWGSVHFEELVQPADTNLFSRPMPGYSHHALFRGDPYVNPKRGASITCELNFDQIDSSVRSCAPQEPQRKRPHELSVDGVLVGLLNSNESSLNEAR